MKHSGHGIQLLIGDGTTYTAIAQIESLTPPGWTREVEPVPTHDDPPGSGIQKIAAALYDGGQATATILYDPADATHQQLEAAKAAQAPTPFRVLYPTSPAHQIDFSAWVVGFAPQDTPANTGLLRAELTLEVTGDETAGPAA